MAIRHIPLSAGTEADGTTWEVWVEFDDATLDITTAGWRNGSTRPLTILLQQANRTRTVTAPAGSTQQATVRRGDYTVSPHPDEPGEYRFNFRVEVT